MALARKHRRLLRQIATPNQRPDGLKWRELRGLLEALGAEVDESAAGSRIHITLRGRTLTIHTHGEIGKGLQKEVWDWLRGLGISVE